MMPEIRQHAPTVTRDVVAGTRIQRHHHREHQIVYPSSGVAQVITDHGRWIAPSDRAVWIPAWCRHEHHFYGPTRFHCVGFSPTGSSDRTEPAVVSATPLLRELIIACSAPEHLPTEESARLRAVLLDRIRRSQDEPLQLPAASDDRLRAACTLVEDDLTVRWTLPGLGRRVGAGERTLSRLFRTEFGLTYPQWRTRLRLHHAMRLLAESVPVTDVAHRCGWSSASAFIDVYRSTLGHTPGTRGS